jgi:hypothetical protein
MVYRGNIALKPLNMTYPIIYTNENINANIVMKTLNKAESELPAFHARNAAKIEIGRKMNNSIADIKLILGLTFTYVSRSSDFVSKNASIYEYNTCEVFI